MKYRRLFFLLLLLLAGLAACSPGHTGSDKIAFVRDGGLWTIYSDGTNAYEIVNGSPRVIGYGWSASHRVLFFRTLDETFAKSAAAKQIPVNPLTGQIGDLPASLNTVGIDGGSPIPMMFSSSELRFSNAWWLPDGLHLLYRTTLTSPSSFIRWQVVQNDQPGGIGSKTLPPSYSIPSAAYTSPMAIGNSQSGLFTTTLAGTDQHYLVRGALPGHPLPASLERVLWQPAHAQPALLYAVAPSQNEPLKVQLILRQQSGQETQLTSCACTQFAWAPDGNHVLYSTGAQYTLLNLDGSPALSIAGESGSIPYWSPDGRFLLLDGLHSLTLVNVATRQQTPLLSAAGAQQTAAQQQLPARDALLQPVTNNLWSADSRHFIFLTRDRLLWQGERLSGGNGLYTVAIDDQSRPQGTPTQVANGNISQPGWTYQDMNTSFLY